MKRALILTLMLTLTIVGFTLSNPTRIAAYELTQMENMQDCKNCDGQTANVSCEVGCILPCSGSALSPLAHMMLSDHIVFITNDTIHRRACSTILRGNTIAPDPSPPKISL
jgi:hypothetical protein